MRDANLTMPASGLREAGKAERQRRLKEATKLVLLQRGYDQATTREISMVAGVSVGTLFVYAKDKRDLLFLVINDELDPIALKAHANIPPDGPPLSRILAFLRPWYAYFAENLAIGRCSFREITYYQHHPEDVGAEALRLRARMEAQEARICEIVRQSRSSGVLAFDEPPSLVSNVIYDIYLTDLRGWVYEPTPDVEAGLARLGMKLALVLDRMSPAQTVRRSK
jgi:AcrR family transcriptional regulator